MNGLAAPVAPEKALRLSGFLLAAGLLLSMPASAGVNRWTSGGLAGKAISSLVVDSRNSSWMYAAAGSDGLFRTFDGGEIWTRVDIGISGGFVEKLAIDAQAPDMLYVIAGSPFKERLFKSVDRGNAWAQTHPASPVYSVSVDPRKQGLVYAGFGANVSTSRDGGAKWSASELPYYCSFFCSAAVASLALDPATPSTIYAGVDADYDYPGTDALFKSTDAGSTWQISDRGLTLWASVYAIAVDPGDSARVFAGMSDGIYLSRDFGQTWSPTSGSAARAFTIDPRNPSVVYAGTDHEGILRSTDRGLHWSPWNVGLSNLQVLSLLIDGTGRLLLAGTRDGVFSYEVAEPSDLLDLFGGFDGTTGFFLFDPRGGGFRLGKVDDSGQKALGSPYGPYAGWIPGAGASGPDGLTRILWNNDDGSAALWLTRPEGVQGSFLYPVRPGWAARDVAAGADGSTHLLWVAADGAMSLWTVDGSGVRTNGFDYGPYSNWSAVAIADGTDGRTRVLWNKTDGTAGLSFFDSSGMLDSYRYGPSDGWRSVDLAIGNDNQTRILRAHADGRIVLWTINADGQPTNYGALYPSPPGYRASRICAGSDGLTRLLWTDPNGSAIVWILSADGHYQSSFPLN